MTKCVCVCVCVGGGRGGGVKHTRVPTSTGHRGPCIPMSEVICSWTGSRVGFSIFTPARRPSTLAEVDVRLRVLLDSRWVYMVYGCPRARERPGMVTAGSCFEADSLVPAFPCWATAAEGWPSSSWPFQPSGSQARFTHARRVASLISRLFNQLENSIWKILDESSR